MSSFVMSSNVLWINLFFLSTSKCQNPVMKYLRINDITMGLLEKRSADKQLRMMQTLRKDV